MQHAPRALIITTAGINCDLELAHAFERAGAAPSFRHLNELIRQPADIHQFDLIGVPGGFSYGDAIAAGRVMAQLMRRHLYPVMVEAIGRGVPIFAPCNGFQILCQVGLLPGPRPGDPWPASPPHPTISLAQNHEGRFVDRWTRVTYPESRCIWTRGLSGDEATGRLPSAHGEGRFVTDQGTLERLRDEQCIVVRYGEGENFNGSMDGIAGICDASGLVFGLMPHPERYTRWTHHPFWTRLDEGATKHDPPGLQMFRNAVAHVRSDEHASQVVV